MAGTGLDRPVGWEAGINQIAKKSLWEYVYATMRPHAAVGHIAVSSCIQRKAIPLLDERRDMVHMDEEH
jgi:hypothetical protein